jgi:hypothetical protein
MAIGINRPEPTDAIYRATREISTDIRISLMVHAVTLLTERDKMSVKIARSARFPQALRFLKLCMEYFVGLKR